MGRNRNKIPIFKERMIPLLHGAGYSTKKIAINLGVSRNTVYYYLHPDKYVDKLEYVRRYERAQRDSWQLELSDWELENG